jgi:hypothetical protein
MPPTWMKYSPGVTRPDRLADVVSPGPSSLQAIGVFEAAGRTATTGSISVEVTVTEASPIAGATTLYQVVEP